jgi:hypothetical protein
MNDELYEPEILKEIAANRATDIGWNIIQLKLKDKFKIDATTQAIKKAYDTYVSKTSEIIATDCEIKYALTKPILDTADQLKKINEITWHMLKNIDINDIVKLGALKEIRSQIELQEKLLQRINQSLDPTQISKIEYTKISVNNLAELEKQGIITINRERSGFRDIINIKQNEEDNSDD